MYIHVNYSQKDEDRRVELTAMIERSLENDDIQLLHVFEEELRILSNRKRLVAKLKESAELKTIEGKGRRP